MDWQLTKTPSASVVSHRASLFGEDQPDTAYRQAVFRIESTQKLTVKHAAGAVGATSNGSQLANMKGIKWLPVDVKSASGKESKDDGKVQRNVTFADNGKPRKVVEYLVLQSRVIKGQEEDWKVWGFAQASTPARIAEDDAYWRKTLDAHAGA
jgi:protein MBA1